MNRDTICVQGGYTPGNGEPRQIPIIQSTTFKYATSEDMGKLFDLEADGYFYSRLQNPTNDAVAARIAALEGGTAAMLTGSGMSAIFFSVFNIVGAVGNADYSARKALNRLVDTEKINIKLFAVAAENARNIAVIERIDKLIAGFSVHIPQWAVGLHCDSLAEK